MSVSVDGWVSERKANINASMINVWNDSGGIKRLAKSDVAARSHEVVECLSSVNVIDPHLLFFPH